MNITDEQLKWISLWTEASLFVGRDGEATVTSPDLAADLLSARQTIAEQEKRIKWFDDMLTKSVEAGIDKDATIAALEAECEAWREDADRLHHHYCHLVRDDSPCDCGAVGIEEFHRQLHERYPTEKSDTEKGE